MLLLIQLSSLFIFSILILSFVKNKKFKIFILLILSVFITAQFNSIILGGSLIDYKFYQHLNLETIWAVKSVFIIQAIKVFIFGIIIGFIYHYVSKNHYLLKISLKIRLGFVAICLISMVTKEGIIHNIYEIYKLKNAVVNANFQESLKSLSSNNNLYISSDSIKIQHNLDTNNVVSKPKNIIVISMESLEKGYLSDNLAHLTPNLRKMAKEMTFFNMEMGSGSDWTTGSIYTELTGFPCFFKNQNNEIFQGVNDTKITSIGHILKQAGYDLTYALALADFAGNREMLRVNKFDVKSEDDFSPKNPLGQWGTHDKDLFNEIKAIIKKKKKSKKPFAMFASTISTHPPDGVYDARMEKLIKKQKTKLEFMVAATDYHIGELMKFLKKEDLIDNTVIYLFPDHLLMGKESDVINRFPQHRSLFLLSNAPKDRFSYSTLKDIYQIDIPKIILEGAGIKHNAKFFTDLIKDNDKIKYINDHKLEILAINESSLIFKDNILKVESKLKPGSRLYSRNKKYSLILQDDGNLVIYRFLSEPIWHTNTGGRKVTTLYLDKKGNLTLKDKSNKIHWSSNSTGHKDSYLILQDDGNLVIYSQNKPIWASNSVQE